MPQTSQPLPAPLLYSLLKALKPPADGVRFKPLNGKRPDAGGKRAVQGALDAARRARSPRQFTTLLGGEPRAQAAASHGSITKLTVAYGQDGYTTVRVTFQDGTQIISVFPTT